MISENPSNAKKIVLFSFFSGSGFLDLGFEKAGYNINFVNEYYPAFLNAYKFSRSKMGFHTPKYGYFDTNINEYLNERKTELRNYILDACREDCLIGFIGGPPCPDFSVGGKNKGCNGENGKLSLAYIDLIIEMKPDFFLFENVKGLWSNKLHRKFYEELKIKLCEHGKYCLTESLINALEFGVPQDRERIFLFGINKDFLNKDSYKDNTILNFKWDMQKKYKIENVKNASWVETSDFKEKEQLQMYQYDDIIEELTVQHWFDKNEVDTHPNAKAYFKPREGLSKMQTIAEGDVSKKSFKRLHRWRYSPTAAYGNNEVHLHPYEARRISAAEALAIQSIPKEFELPSDMKLSDMFKTIGNGVPYLLSKAIAETIKNYLETSTYKNKKEEIPVDK